MAAQHGADVTLIERDGIGGACVLSDCVPSKTFIASAGGRTAFHDAERARRHGRPDAGGRRPAGGARPGRGLALAQSADIRDQRCSARASTVIDGTARAAPTRSPDWPRTRSWRPRTAASRPRYRRRRGADRHRRQPADPARRRPGRRAHPDLAPDLRPRPNCPST